MPILLQYCRPRIGMNRYRGVGRRLLAVLKKIYDYEMTLAEWIGLAAILAAPYLAIGVVWSVTHAESMGRIPSLGFVVSFTKATLTWPWLMFSSVLCLS